MNKSKSTPWNTVDMYCVTENCALLIPTIGNQMSSNLSTFHCFLVMPILTSMGSYVLPHFTVTPLLWELLASVKSCVWYWVAQESHPSGTYKLKELWFCLNKPQAALLSPSNSLLDHWCCSATHSDNLRALWLAVFPCPSMQFLAV